MTNVRNTSNTSKSATVTHRDWQAASASRLSLRGGGGTCRFVVSSLSRSDLRYVRSPVEVFLTRRTLALFIK